MTIIKHGTPKAPVEDMIAECPRCKCVFTFGEHESTRCSNNGGGSVFFHRCPECLSSGPYFDTGYPHVNDGARLADIAVKAEHARLRAMIPQEERDGT